MDETRKDTNVTIAMAKAEVARIDEWRRAQADLPNRSEAIRRLIEQALREQ